MSARNYMTDAQLVEDARHWRAEETELKLRARTEWDSAGGFSQPSRRVSG